MADFRDGDFGRTIRLTIKDQDGSAVDVSAATTKQIILKPKGGTGAAKTAAFYTDGTDGKVQYALVSGDLNAHVQGQYGSEQTWYVQGRIATATTDWNTTEATFTVSRSLA